MNSQLFKNLVLWLVIFVAIIALYQLVHTPRSNIQEIPYSDFLSNVEKGEVKDLDFKGEEIKGQYTNPVGDQSAEGFKTMGPANDDLIKKLDENAWNISKTAEVLDMERSNLHRKIKTYDIKVP